MATDTVDITLLSKGFPPVRAVPLSDALHFEEITKVPASAACPTDTK